MKKYIILMLAMLLAISMVACGKDAGSDTPSIKPPVVEQDNSELIKKIDESINDMLGDYIIATDYEDDVYSVMMTCRGIKNAVGTEEYYNVCISLDDVAVAINEDHNINCAIFLVNDKDYNDILYVTYNGKDVTNSIG